MGGRPAVPRDEREHLVEVEQRGVRRCEVAGDEHEGRVRLGDAGGGHAREAGDDALRHVAEVGRALRHVAAEADEHHLELEERLVHRALARAALPDAGDDVVDERGVLGHERLRVEHVLRGAAGPRAALRELGRDLLQRAARAGDLGVRVGGRLRLRRLGERIGHAPHRSRGESPADADP